MNTIGDASGQQLEALRDHFKAEWAAAPSLDRGPPIQPYLDEAAESDQPALLASLVRLDWHYRSLAGERPTIERYAAQFPEWADALRQLGEQLAAETTLPPSGGREPPQEARSPSAAAPGLGRVGRYELKEVLGRGRGGTVYRGWDAQLRREVAVKLPRGQPAGDADEQFGAFLAEARKLARLDHPGIVPVYDYGCEGGTCFVVSRLAAGCDLAATMRQRRLSPAESARLVVEVADALHYAHGRGLVHRDVKPGNILLEENGRPLLADFGLALFEEEQPERRGEVSGTVAYMAPEQVRGESDRLDGRCDIWALGVMLYELLTGRRPFRGETATEVFDEIEHRDPKPPRMIDSTVPAELQQFVLRCLQKRVADRYPTADELAGALRGWLVRCSDAGSAPISDGPSAPGASRARRRAAVLVAAAAAALLLAGAFVWQRLGGTPGLGFEPVAKVEVETSGLAAEPPLDGTVGVRIWNPGDSRRRGLTLTDPGARPLRGGDQIRVEAELHPPGYAYLVWIGADGKAAPVYPWRPGDWTARPSREQPVGHLALPERLDEGWPVSGPPGMQTLVLLARETPLPSTADLPSLLAGLPRQPAQSPQAIVWLDRGRLLADPTRAPQFFNPGEIDDPVLRAQQLLAERLEEHFPVIRAVSFASTVGGPAQENDADENW